MSAGIDRTALAKIIEETIDSLRHETRLYPDVYSEMVADAVIERQVEWCPKPMNFVTPVHPKVIDALYLTSFRRK